MAQKLNSHQKKSVCAENAILLILKNERDILRGFVTLSSLIKNIDNCARVRVVSLSEIPEEIQAAFKSLSTPQVDVQITPISEPMFDNEQNLLCQILSDWEGPKKVLYLSSHCLVRSGLDDFFKMPMRGRALCCRAGNRLLDMNVILFDLKSWKKVSRTIPYIREEISDKKWNTLLWPQALPLPITFNYFMSEFLDLTPQVLSEMKILTYDIQQPWRNLKIPLGYLWWQQARTTRFYEEILSQSETEKSAESLSRQKVLKKFYQDEEKLSPLVNAYVKEAFLYCFTFGKKAKEHKEVLIQLHYKILNRVNR